MGIAHKASEPDTVLVSGSPVYYVSGPMTGIPEFNFPAFAAKTAELRAEGLTVVSPHEVAGDLGHPWDYYLRKDIRALMDCTHVVLLDGWEASRGARLEVHIARALGMTVIEPGASA